MRGFTNRALAAVLVFGLPLASAAEPTFDSADLHASGPNTIPEMRVAFNRGRYELQNATPVDLIRTAWNVDADNIVGGPEWLDAKRFDLAATAPPTSTPETLHAMLQNLLKDRFQLAVHNASKTVPAYTITAGKKPQLQQADGDGPTGCDLQQAPGRPPQGAPPPPLTYTCRNETMAALAKSLPNVRQASGYLLNYPVMDRTGLKGSWNFSVQWSPRNSLLANSPGGIPIFDAFEKQLGLNLTLTKVSVPVLFVDKAAEPRVTDSPQRRFAFEVADIRPGDPTDPANPSCSNVAIRPGGSVRIIMTLRGLILETQGDINTHRIVFSSKAAEPKSMDSPCWIIVAKAPVPENTALGWNGPVWNGTDVDQMRAMLRSLLEDRFKLVAHTEDRLVAGYALVAAKPRLRRADPSNRAGCHEGPGAEATASNWKDPRFINPIASRLLTCRNMTLSQFAAELNRSYTGAGGTIVDATGIDGRFDFTINFSPASALGLNPSAGPDASPSEPTGAISIFEAVSKQLGLKLESRQVPAAALVIDQITDQPTDN